MRKRKAIQVDGVWCMPLTRGKFTLLDADDVSWAEQWNWSLVTSPRHKDGYAVSKTKAGIIRLHRILAERLGWDLSEDREIDHINGNSLDNRRANIRVCLKEENARNKARMSHNTSGQSGVTWHKKHGKWYVRVSLPGGRRKSVGLFKTFPEAVEARLQAEAEVYKEFAPSVCRGPKCP